MYDKKNKFKTIAVTNRKLCDGDFIKQIKVIAKSGIFDKIILREKDLSEDKYIKFAREIQSICCENNVQFFVNTFYNVAEKINSEGLQLPYKMFLKYNKNNFNGQIAVSVHSVDEAKAAAELGADFLIAGHIFATDCKKGIPPRGIEFLKNVVNAVNIPVYAIGGINYENAELCVNAGADGVCVMSGAMKFTGKKIC